MKETTGENTKKVEVKTEEPPKEKDKVEEKTELVSMGRFCWIDAC